MDKIIRIIHLLGNMKETATEVLIRTSGKWYRIRHLNPCIRKRLMSLSEDEFETELQEMIKSSA